MSRPSSPSTATEPMSVHTPAFRVKSRRASTTGWSASGAEGGQIMPLSVLRPPQNSGRHTRSAPFATASPARRLATSMASSKVAVAGVCTQPIRTSLLERMACSPVIA